MFPLLMRKVYSPASYSRLTVFSRSSLSILDFGTLFARSFHLVNGLLSLSMSASATRAASPVNLSDTVTPLALWVYLLLLPSFSSYSSSISSIPTTSSLFPLFLSSVPSSSRLFSSAESKLTATYRLLNFLVFCFFIFFLSSSLDLEPAVSAELKILSSMAAAAIPSTFVYAIIFP